MVKEYGLNAGASVVGIASAKDFSSAPEGFNPIDAMEGCLSVIVLGSPIPKEAILADDTVGFIDVRNTVNKKINDITKDVEKWIKGRGYKAQAVVGMSGKWVERDGRKVQVGSISLKHAAELAGLGVIGRNYLLINPQYGNLLWFSAILTNLDLTPDQRFVAGTSNLKNFDYNFCDGCSICVEACPSGALDNYPVTFDRKKCDGTMFKMIDKKWEIMCFLCRKMCPYCLGTDMPDEYEIIMADESDAEEILRLQYAAYQSEAAIYNNYSVQPLMQTLEQTLDEFKESTVLKAVLNRKIIGSVRAAEKENSVYIGKLMVLPEYQNAGVGKRLLKMIEGMFSGKRYWLITGDKSEKNLRLYEKCGYSRFKTEEASTWLTLIYLEKIES